MSSLFIIILRAVNIVVWSILGVLGLAAVALCLYAIAIVIGSYFQ